MYHANMNVYLMVENIIQIKSEIMINIDASVKNICEKDYTWNPVKCSCENGKYLASIIGDDSVITCDEIIEDPETIPKNFNEKERACKTQNFTCINYTCIFINYHCIVDSCCIYFYLIKY